MTVNEWAKDFRSFVNELQMPRDDYNGIMEYIDDGFALLKDQEAVPVIQCEVMHLLMWCCGSCGTAITHGDKFCRMCGRPVKWK